LNAVELRGIGKSFGDFVALEDVSLAVEQGEIHAIVGENGAGKTTLMRILYGALAPDSGTVAVHGRAKRFRSPQEAIASGVGMVSQHYGIIGELDCLQNLIVGAEGGFRIDRRRAEERATALASQMGFSFDWRAEASTLSPGSAQKLEILKLLWRNAEVLILDEPTAMLSPSDADALFESLHQLAEAGKTVLVVTHRIPEVLDHCRRVTVLRGGRLVAVREVSETTASELASLIVGEAMDDMPAPVSRASEEIVLEAKGLTVKGYRGDDAVKGVDLVLHKGEVLGIAGVDGNGQRELIHALQGLADFTGQLHVFGRDWHGVSVRERLAQGLRVIPEDRLAEALIESWPIRENASLGLHRIGMEVDASEIAARFSTKYASLDQPIGGLSGGNQQRFVAGRALHTRPKLLLAFQPARGLDLKATREVYDSIRQLCAEGASALIVSFDLDELLAYCDRVVAMNRGRIYEPAARDREEIGRLMVAT
jgi:simple sugar transport system ATP-binding protein